MKLLYLRIHFFAYYFKLFGFFIKECKKLTSLFSLYWFYEPVFIIIKQG
ncbi:MAG: hypothetical protein R6V04_08235 [bacterium]